MSWSEFDLTMWRDNRRTEEELAKHKRDLNHAEVTRFLKGCGCSVHDTSKVGGGFPDIAVGFRRHTFLVEIKSANGRLLESQKNFGNNWAGDLPIVAYSGEEAMKEMLGRIDIDGTF